MKSCDQPHAGFWRLSLFMENVEEVWKDIEGYDGYYQISNLVRVRSWNGDKKELKNRLETPIILAHLNQGQGYLAVILAKNKVARQHKIHRLVATYFIPNPNNYEFVNHINFDRKDNRIENLEWVSRRENITHGILNKKTASKYPGVTRYNDKRAPKSKFWRARIVVDKKEIFLGLHKEEIDAYNAVLAYMDKFGIINKYARI